MFSPGLEKMVWTYDAGRAPSLSGEPPRVRALGGDVFVLVRRNHGCELNRLAPVDGESVWDDPAFLDADRVDLAATDVDDERVYVPAGTKLTALLLEDGSAAWAAALPKLHGAAGWRVRAGKNVVIAYPVEAIPGEPVADVWVRVVRSFGRAPLAWRLPLLADTLVETWADRTVPVLLFDPETGELLKCVVLPARGPGVSAHFDGAVAVVVTGAGAAWLR